MPQACYQLPHVETPKQFIKQSLDPAIVSFVSSQVPHGIIEQCHFLLYSLYQLWPIGFYETVVVQTWQVLMLHVGSASVLVVLSGRKPRCARHIDASEYSKTSVELTAFWTFLRLTHYFIFIISITNWIEELIDVT